MTSRRCRRYFGAGVVVAALLFCGCRRGASDLSEAKSRRGPSRASPTKASSEPSASESEPAPKPSAAAPLRPTIDDEGVFSDLDAEVELSFPDRLRDAPVVAARKTERTQSFFFVDGVSVGLAPRDSEPTHTVEEWGDADIDGDGIPNQIDILLGAKKAALNGADYRGGYEPMDYPGGDVPRSRGVCTDVIVRTLRNAGIDLQMRLHEDIVDHPEAYPMVETPDPNIDQRRVRTILPYFERHWKSLSTDPKDSGERWLPGDVVFMDTLEGPDADHVGVLSDREGDSGLPLVVNNWTNGYETSAMDLLDSIPVTHRFRLASAAVELPSPETSSSSAP